MPLPTTSRNITAWGYPMKLDSSMSGMDERKHFFRQQNLMAILKKGIVKGIGPVASGQGS